MLMPRPPAAAGGAAASSAAPAPGKAPETATLVTSHSIASRRLLLVFGPRILWYFMLLRFFPAPPVVFLINHVWTLFKCPSLSSTR